MANQLNNFDQQIKNSFDGYEVPYDSDHWEELQSELNSSTPSITSYFGAITTGLVATGIVFVAMLFFMSDSNVESKRNAIAEETQIEVVDGSEILSGTPTEVEDKADADSKTHITGSESDQKVASLSDKDESNDATPTTFVFSSDKKSST